MVVSQGNKAHYCVKRIDCPKSFETVYNLYWERVYAICYTHIRETESAKEMVQDIFKSLWERREELEITTSIEHYLFRAAKLKVFEYIRNKTIRQKHIACVMQESCDTTNCTEEVVLFNGLVEKVNLLVERLPCKCKRVYKMSREEGMSNKEIASALLISERAVEYHITKAFTFLRQNLLEYQLQ